MEKRQTKTVARTIRKSSDIDDLMDSYQNSIAVKKKTGTTDMFRILVEINEEKEEIDKEYDDEIWSDDTDLKILSFKQKVHN